MRMSIRNHLLKPVTMLASLNRNWHKYNRNHISHLITIICNKYVHFFCWSFFLLRQASNHRTLSRHQSLPTCYRQNGNQKSEYLACNLHDSLQTNTEINCFFLCGYARFSGQFTKPWSITGPNTYVTIDCSSNSTFLVAYDTSISAPTIIYVSNSTRYVCFPFQDDFQVLHSFKKLHQNLTICSISFLILQLKIVPSI